MECWGKQEQEAGGRSAQVENLKGGAGDLGCSRRYYQSKSTLNTVLRSRSQKLKPPVLFKVFAKLDLPFFTGPHSRFLYLTLLFAIIIPNTPLLKGTTSNIS